MNANKDFFYNAMVTSGNTSTPIGNNNGTYTIQTNGTGTATSLPQYTFTYPGVSHAPYTIYPGMSSVSIPIYTFLKLHRSDMPEKVFVTGELKTLGTVGSHAQCMYDGQSIIFAPGAISNFLDVFYKHNNTISIEYFDEIHHFNVDEVPTSSNGHNNIKAKLISKISKRQRDK